MLLLAAPLVLMLAKFGPPVLKDSVLLHQLQIPLAIFVLFRLVYLVKKRYDLLHVFDGTNIPSVENPNPISGNLFQVILREENLLTIHKYHEKLGKTFGLLYGPEPWVMTLDLDLIYKLFVSEGSKYVDITQYNFPFSKEMGDSLSQVGGNEWRQTRRLLNPSFTAKQMKSDNVSEDVNQACDKVLHYIQAHGIEKETKARGGASRVVDVLDLARRFGIEVIFQVAFGKSDGVNFNPEEQETLVDLTNRGSKLITTSPVVWLSIMFPQLQRTLGLLTRFTALGDAIKYIRGILDDSVEARRNKKIESSERKMIDSLIEAAANGKMNDSKLKSNLFFFFLAGFETTSNTAALTLYHLAKNQKIQDKLRASILIDGEQSEYLDWCMRETLRLYPAVPTAIGRVIHEDFEFNGYNFKSRMTINASIWSIHHSREYWGEDVDEYKPERFGQSLGHTMQYFAFAHGPRYCIGMNLALSELRAILVRLLARYKLECCPSTPMELEVKSPNIIHSVIEGKINLKFVELSSL